MKILFGVALILFSASIGVHAQEFSVPEKPQKKEILAKNADVNDRNLAGYLGLNSTIVIPLDGENYAILYGVIAGKRKGDSFHYFENPDLGLVCNGAGKSTPKGGVITNECFLNGGSIGKQNISVPNYGKTSGKLLFDTHDNNGKIGLAAMQWGLSYPNYKKLYKFLKANGG